MTLTAAALASTDAGAEIIRKEEMLHAITTTRERCTATDETRPVVFLSGDHFGTVRKQRVPVSKDKDASVTFDPTNPASHGDVSTDDLVKPAGALSKLSKTTAIYLARIDVDGTSANHVFRKTLLEPHPIGAALGAIKHRYGFGCALGRVATPVGTPVKRNAAYNEHRRQEIALFGTNGTARLSAEPAAGHPARTGGKRA
jgi:hypothetical protein